MKKIRRIISALLLVMLMGTTTVVRMDAMSDTSEQTTTNEEIVISNSLEDMTILKSANITDNLMEPNADIAVPPQSKSVKSNETLVIEKSSRVKKTKAKKKKKKVKKAKKAKSNIKYAGTFKITGYCSCSSCCGKSNGITASGTRATAGRTIAADTSKFPFGTQMIIDGHTYTVEDRGGAISGNRIDMFFSSHDSALQWGVRYCDVYIQKQ